LSVTGLQLASGHGVIDQSSPGPRTPGQANIPTAEIHGQSFKTTAKNIVAVEVELAQSDVVSAEPITIRIRDGEGLGGTILGSTQTHTGLPGSGFGIVHFDFPNPIPLIPGNSYTFTLELNNANDLFEIRLTRNGNAPYADGTAFIVQQPEASDLIFNTFFDPSQTPVGGELIPIETTSLILAGAQTFSWMIPVVLSVLGIGLFVVSRKSE